jgi:hypothetical protein
MLRSFQAHRDRRAGRDVSHEAPAVRTNVSESLRDRRGAHQRGAKRWKPRILAARDAGAGSFQQGFPQIL